MDENKNSKPSKDEIINRQVQIIAELEKEKASNSLLNVIALNFKDIMELGKEYFQHQNGLNKSGIRFSLGLSIIAAFLILIIVGAAGFLTYHEKIDGSTFTFLLGTIVGYLLTFIQRAINPDEE